MVNLVRQGAPVTENICAKFRRRRLESG